MDDSAQDYTDDQVSPTIASMTIKPGSSQWSHYWRDTVVAPGLSELTDPAIEPLGDSSEQAKNLIGLFRWNSVGTEEKDAASKALWHSYMRYVRLAALD